MVHVAGRRKDQTEFPIELSLSAMKLKEQWHAVGIIRDISERLAAEESLRQGEERYRQIVENANDAIYSTDANGLFHIYESVGLKITGIRRMKLSGGSTWTWFGPMSSKRRNPFTEISSFR